MAVAGRPVAALVDTGAKLSFVTVPVAAGFPGRDGPPVVLRLADGGESVPLTRRVALPCELGRRREEVEFLVWPDACQEVILGRDVLAAWGAIVDVGQEVLRLQPRRGRAELAETVPFLGGGANRPGVAVVGVPAEYADVLPPEAFFDGQTLGRARGVEHAVDTGDAPPRYEGPRPTSAADRQVVEEELAKMLRLGVVRPSRSPWGAPVVLVAKKDGSRRFCVDYRRLNDVTVKDRYPLPRITDMLESLAGARVFSVLDAASGYWQIPMAEGDVQKTAFSCHAGLFEFTVMPFGLCNAPATYQRAMNYALAGLLWKFLAVYIDDILVYSRTPEEHRRHLAAAIARLREAGIVLNAKKCRFGLDRVEYLGHIVSAEGVAPDPRKVERIRGFPAPETKKQLQVFLGLSGYYRRFIRRYGEMAAPLHAAAAGGGPLAWTPECQAAFEQIREHLCRAPILHFPDPAKPLLLDCDASEIGFGAVLSQAGPEGERIIAVESRKWTAAEAKWHIREKEALAIIEGLERHRRFLLGRPFVVRSDHKSLEWLAAAKAGRLARWALRLGEYQPFELVYRPGGEHRNVDAFTRVFAESEGLPDRAFVAAVGVDTAEGALPRRDALVEAQWADPALRRLLERGAIEFRAGVMGQARGGRWRPWLPATLVGGVAERLHASAVGAHLGARRLHSLLAARYAGVRARDVRQAVGRCDPCRQRKAPPGRWGLLRSEIPDTPWRTVAADFAGPYCPTTAGCRYVLVFMDQFTKWVELVATPDQTAATVVRAFYRHVLCRHGCPQRLLTDNGPSFRGELVRALCDEFRVAKVFSTAYYPQGDGYAERFMRTLNNSLAVLSREDPERWDEYLPGVQFGYNITEHAATGETPFALNYGRLPALVGGEGREAAEPEGTVAAHVRRLRRAVRKAQDHARRCLEGYYGQMKARFDRGRRERDWAKGDLVLVRLSDRQRNQFPCPKLAPRWSDPRQLLEGGTGPTLLVADGRGGAERINVHRLLPAAGVSRAGWSGPEKGGGCVGPEGRGPPTSRYEASWPGELAPMTPVAPAPWVGPAQGRTEGRRGAGPGGDGMGGGVGRDPPSPGRRAPPGGESPGPGEDPAAGSAGSPGPVVVAIPSGSSSAGGPAPTPGAGERGGARPSTPSAESASTWEPPEGGSVGSWELVL
jgi:transposase InsO family protein